MNVNRMVTMIAGIMIMLTLVLGHVMGQIDMSSMSWLWFTAFIGFNLFQSSITGFCPMASILKAVGVKDA